MRLWIHIPTLLKELEMVKSLTWLVDSMLSDASIRCSTDTHRDIVTVSRRTEHEGVSFLTITLPNFNVDFEKALREGRVDSSLFLGFKRRQALPAFLQGLLSQVFCPISGRLLEDPSVEAILCVRQICLAHKKVYLDCTKQRVAKAYAQYQIVETELTDLPDTLPIRDKILFETISGCLWNKVLGTLDRKIRNHELVPRHGPGATAERVYGNAKYKLTRWHTRLQPFFPFDMYGISNPDMIGWFDDWKQVEFVEPGAEEPVRVITVPKTLKAPRIIAIEPVCMQYIQQSLMEALVKSIESTGDSAGHVNFRDQTVNRELARSSSVSGDFATLDLSEASDRVHKDVVASMLKSHPLVKDAIFACRSQRAQLPDGCIVHLEKFASMGSALCFPIEAMVFFTICILARLKVHSLPPTPRNITKMSKGVYIYGDDIIVPADEVPVVSASLELFGLKVSLSKSFWTGKFRESCGMDAYDGVNVTPVYVRHTTPTRKVNTTEIVSFVSLANQLYTNGWWGTARRVREKVEAILGPLPTVQETSPCLGWITANKGYSITKWDSDLQTFKVKGHVVRTSLQTDPLDGQAALMKFFLKRGRTPASEGHLERSSRPGSVYIKSRWVLPY
jgi:hypothetical protein